MGELNELLQQPRRAAAAQQFWLIVDTRIAVFHVDGIDLDDRFVLFKAHPEDEGFAATVARTEREIAHAVKDRVTAVNLERLDDRSEERRVGKECRSRWS